MNNKTDNRRPDPVDPIRGTLLIGLAGLVVLPTCGILCTSFAAIGIGLPILSVLNLIGLTNIPFNILFWHIRGIPQVLLATGFGIVFLILSRLCFRGLKKFCAFRRKITRW